MVNSILQNIRLTIVSILLLAILYPLLIKGISILTPQNGVPYTVQYKGKMHFRDIGQHFHSPQYFQSRPSATNYNPAGSAGSNKGPTNPEYLQQVQSRIDTFIAGNPTITTGKIPADLITASGSGLDPHLSPNAAHIQVDRIAKIRKLSPEIIHTLIQQHTEEPLWGILGPAKVNVLLLNIALDSIQLSEK